MVNNEWLQIERAIKIELVKDESLDLLCLIEMLRVCLSGAVLATSLGLPL